MTPQEAKKMLKAKLECLKNETSGINYDCNMRLCDGCSLNYEQGNMGEQKEALDMAIKALEKDIAKEPVQTHKRYGHGNEYDDYYCPECDEFLAYEPQGSGYKQEGGWSRCRNCGQRIKWGSENNGE